MKSIPNKPKNQNSISPENYPSHTSQKSTEKYPNPQQKIFFKSKSNFSPKISSNAQKELFKSKKLIPLINQKNNIVEDVQEEVASEVFLINDSTINEYQMRTHNLLNRESNRYEAFKLYKNSL